MFNETENQIINVVHELAESKIKPRAREIDEKAYVPEDIIQAMRDMGLFALYIPEKYGGNGLRFSVLMKIIEEISYACPSTALILDGTLTLFAEPVIMFGSEDLKQRYLTRVASGEIGGLAITEPGAGSDAASITTRAEKSGDGYVINGTKTFISNGRTAKFFVVDTSTDRALKHKGITTFVVDANTPGLEISRDIHKLGIRGSSTVELNFNNVFVDSSNIVGKYNDGFRVIMETLDAGRVGVAAQALGIAKSAFDEALEYINTRRQFGNKIINFEGIQFTIAEMESRIKASELLIYDAADKYDKKQNSIEASSIAKMYASDTAMYVAERSLQLFGGYGYTTDFNAERHLRDAKITQIYEGTNEIQKLIIAREIMKGHGFM
ncbi:MULTISPECIES: acyl-CoA dehydrogenase family protein [Acidiplasma]|jgi:alkylation response protein AidB-like acyl-CoA dehydrogenase|uniref:Acyl-CoA dehydrogenase n=2 Tax=Acidiplasma TaxID=507753 RepID=A0A0Q0RI53_9ARCH|nr:MULTISPECIES: acyl-CoA dehydrogenase family protein [Acidiplasma]KJE49701.1 acyl-CoA dehydrogenase [Acidiplasma sp. MBA-1]KPV46450.1 acyl-CoA dehydrogenase [Acidiplasma aeolicum]KQB34162.1 acyl-CoA dehydrogenase [Acidiplasma aeolicum]KQB35026.1 acyl-CoA dehydrogenase [Acidiplasma cupricumulans]WMT55641.1 MAG: acyl-CoA dehydrogenase family protein [Acidiplasma sp.]